MLFASLGLLLMLSPADALTTIDTTSIDGNASYVGGIGGGYDALETKGRRRAGASRIVREDNLLMHGKRTKLSATTQELVKNFSIAGWMIRRHLDYVALFDFHSRCATQKALRTKYDVDALQKLDDDIERIMAEDSAADRFDAACRFHREKFFRLAEMRRTVDGDVGLLQLRSGQLQGIESDLIRNPTDTDIRKSQFGDLGKLTEWVAGVRIGTAGKASAYAVHRRGRGGSGYEMQRVVHSRNLIHYGHFTRFASDQVRGVSPIVSALNNLRDVYGAFDLAMAKMKVSQLFALAIYSDAVDGSGEVGVDEEDEDGEARKYNVDFGTGPVHLELDAGDRAEFLESKTPSTEMQNFSHLVVAVALKSLDIPYSFYDESHTNFFGSRAAWLHYERSCIDKRDDQIQMRRRYTSGKLIAAVSSGRLELPRGMMLSEVVTEWVPRGMPWWDPAKEIRGDKEAVAAGFDNPERICKRTGMGDVYDNIRTTCRVIAEARKISQEELGDPNGFVPDFTAGPVMTPEPPDPRDAPPVKKQNTNEGDDE